jgi:hypothetical protein
VGRTCHDKKITAGSQPFNSLLTEQTCPADAARRFRIGETLFQRFFPISDNFRAVLAFCSVLSVFIWNYSI